MVADSSQRSSGVVAVDDAGLHLSPGFSGSADVYFDAHHAWSFSVVEAGAAGGADERLVRWPQRMTRWLNGRSEVRVVSGDQTLYHGEVVLGDGVGRVRFVDKDGIPVMIDKWGLLQRPFSGRDPKVVDQLVDVATQIIEVMDRECGLQAWIAFGTLLGAAREGKVIGHDSDVDLAYLSEQPTPSEMVSELLGVTRALRAAGFNVQRKSGSFITVVFRSADGATASIDVYTCFYVGDLLHETATVRAKVPREAIVPLGEIEFEGRSMPAPADPDRMLAVSYGDGWRVPDPSFRHTPGPDVTERFDGWFGSLMRQRRDWERFLADRAEVDASSEFAEWVADRLTKDERVVEVGCGTGADALAIAGRGFEVLGLDYARNVLADARRRARRSSLPASFAEMNLYDLRDVLTRAALVARHRGPQVLYARQLLETLDGDGLGNFWRFARMTMRPSGRAFLEGCTMSRSAAARWRAEHGGGRLRPLGPEAVSRAVAEAAGTVLSVEEGAHHWRMMVEWQQ